MSELDQKTIYIRELLAFQLFGHSVGSDKTSEKDRTLWQEQSEETRKGFRDMADCFSKQLEGQGMRVRVSDSVAVTKSLEWLMTIPARPAYELPTGPG